MLHKLFQHRLFRFSIVGSAAAASHLIALGLIVSYFRLNPLLANIIAFLIAFNVSFLGHHYWTFSDLGKRKHLNIARFFLVAVISFGLNEFLFAALLHFLKIHYLIAMIVTLIMVALATFLSSRYWAFK